MLQDFIVEFSMDYIDYLHIFTNDLESHCKYLYTGLQHLHGNEFCMYPKQWEFLKEDIYILYMLIDSNGIDVNVEEVKVSQTGPKPR